MHSRRFAAAFLTLLTAFAITAYVAPIGFVHAEGGDSGKQCPAEKKNEQEYQPAKPWNTSYKEKRGDTVYTIKNLFGKPCKDVTNEEVVTGHCIRVDTCKADKTAEGKKPQTCLETKECPPGSNVGNTEGGADENEELPYFEEPKPDNSDGVLPLKEEQKPGAKQLTFEEMWQPVDTKPINPLQSMWETAQNFLNPQTPKPEDSTMTGFGPQQMMQPVPDNGLPNSGAGQPLYKQAFNTDTTGFGNQPTVPQPDTPAQKEQTWGDWFAEKYAAAKGYFTGPVTESIAATEGGEIPKDVPAPDTQAPAQKDLTDPFPTNEDLKPLPNTTPKAEPFKDYGMITYDKNGLPQYADGIADATAKRIEALENSPDAEYYPDVDGDQKRLSDDLKAMDDRVKEYNKGPACAPSCTPAQVAAYQAKGEALRTEQAELLRSRDVYNELVKAERFEAQLSRPLTGEQLRPFTGSGPTSDPARNVFNAETAALREIGQQQVNAFWNNTSVPQPDLVADQNRIAGNVFSAADNQITPQMQREAYQDFTKVLDARDDRTIATAEERLAAVRAEILKTPDNWQTMDPMMGTMVQDAGRAALEREAAALEKQIAAAEARQEERDTVREFLAEHPKGDRIGETLLNTKSPAVERAMTDAIVKYQKEAAGLERFDNGINLDSKVSNWINDNVYGGYDNLTRSYYTDSMSKFESQMDQLTGDAKMSSQMQNKLDTLSGNYNALYQGAYAVQDYLRDARSLDGAADKPYYVLSGPAAFLASGVVDPLVGATIGSREYYLAAPDRSTFENINSWRDDVVMTALNATMVPGVMSKLGGAAIAAEARTFGEIASIGEGVNAYTRVGSSLEPTFANTALRTDLALTQDGVNAGALAAARDIAPLEVNSYRSGTLGAGANDNGRLIVSGNDNFVGGAGPGGSARSIGAGVGDDVVAAGRSVEGGGINNGTVTSLADARAAAGARTAATETGSTFGTEGSAAIKTDPFAGRGVTTVEGQAFQANRFTAADAALAKGNVANDNFVGGASAPRTTVPATAPSTVPYGDFGYRPPAAVAPTWYQPADNTLYSELTPSGNLAPANSYPISYDGLNQFAPTPVTPVSPVALSTGSPLPISPVAPVSPVSPISPISPVTPVTPSLSPAPPQFVTPADYIRQTYGDAAGQAAREAQAYGASPFDWANFMGAIGGAGGAKDAGAAPSSPYPTTEYKPSAVIKPIKAPAPPAPKKLSDVAVQALKEIGVIPATPIETHPAQFPKEIFDHETNTYFQRLGDGRYLAQNFETGEVSTVPPRDIGDLIDASRYDGNLEVAPGVFLKEPIRAETTFADAALNAVENGLGISPTAQSLATRAGVTNGARPIASNRTLNPDVVAEQIPLVEIKNVPGSRDLRALDYPEALAIREFNSSLANYSKALVSGADISRASDLVANAYDDLLERGIFADDAGNLYRTESPTYPVAVPVSPQMAAQAAYAVVVPIDPMVREFVTGSTDETFAFDVPDLRILSSNFGVQPPITSDEALLLKRINDILETTRSRDSLLYLFEDAPLLIRPQDGYIVRPNGEVVARPEGTNPLPGALPDRFVPSGPVPPLPVQLVKINTTPTQGNKIRETYVAQDYKGRRVAAVEVTIEGAVANIDKLRAYRPGEQTWTQHSNTLTPSTVRSMLAQFKAAHPEVQALSGQLMSGTQFAGVWDPADVGIPVEVALAEVPSEILSAPIPEPPSPVLTEPTNRSFFDPLPIAIALGLTFGSPIPMNTIGDVLGDAGRAFSNAAQARPQSRPGRPVERDLVRRDQAIADIGKVRKGIASWYSTGSNGGTNPSDVTASGALHRNDVNTVAMLGAAPKYPWGTVLTVKNVQKRLRSGAPNPAYGREIEVVVTSTGSQWNRDLDLSPKARDEIGIGADGTAEVEYIVKYIPPLNEIGYWLNRTDLNNGVGSVPKGTFDTQLAALKQNTQLAFGDTGFSNQPTVANTGINSPRSLIAPDLSQQISGNTAYKPIVIPNWELPTPQLTITPAEPLAANPAPIVERENLADIPEPLAANPVTPVERGADLPAPAQPAQVPVSPVDRSLRGQPEPAAIQPSVPEIKSTPNPLDQSRFGKAVSRTVDAIKNLDGELLRDTAVKSYKKIAASMGLGPKESAVVPDARKAPFDAEAIQGSELSYVCGSSAACTEKTSDAVLVTAEPGRTFARIEAGDTPVNPRLGEAALPANDAKFLARAAGGFVTAGQGGKAVSQDITYNQGRLVGSKTINPNGSQGLALTNKKGDGVLVDKRAIPYSAFQKLGADIGTNAPADVLDVTKDFAAFDKLMRDNELSAFSNLLLIKDGAIQNVVSSIAEPRRLLIQLQDGRLGILNSTKDQTMLGITQIAKALGAQYAVNLDTGAFNEGRVAVQSGEAPYIGSSVKSDALTNIYLGVRNTPSPEVGAVESAPSDAPFTGQPQPDASPARVPTTPSPSPVESFGTNVRRPEFEESPATSPIASNDNLPPLRALGSPIPLSPIPNDRMLAAYVPPRANPALGDFQQPTLYANSQGGIWPTVDGARKALVLDGEILPPAPVARSGSEVASPRPDLELTANPNPSIAPTRVIGAPTPETGLDGEIIPPSPVARADTEVGQPKPVLDLQANPDPSIAATRPLAAPRPDTVLDGEIIPPSRVGRSDSEVGQQKPVLDLQANRQGIAPTRGLPAPAQPTPQGGLTAPTQVQRIAYTGSNALGQPKVVLNLDILGNKALVTMRSVDAVTIPSVEEIESLLRQLLARHPEVSELGVGAIPNDKALTVVRPPVNLLPALENELMTGPTLYVNARGEVWPSLATAEIDMGIRNIVAQIRAQKILDTGIRAIERQVIAERTIDKGIAQIAKQIGAEKTIDDGIRQIGKQVGAEKTIDDGIAQIAWQVGTQKKIDDAMKAIVSPELAIEDGIADIVSRIQPGEGAQPVQPTRTSVPSVTAPRQGGVPVTPERVLEDAIRDFAGASEPAPVARTSPRPDVSVPPPLPSRPIGEIVKNIWSDTKLAARVSRGVVFPASTIRRNVAVNALNMMVAYNLTGPYTVLTWPALNVGWRYVFNKDYRADINGLASRVSTALADARATRDAARAAEELLTPSAPRTSVPQVTPTVARAETPVSIEDGIRDIVSNMERTPAPEVSIEEGIRDIVSGIKPTPEAVIDSGIADMVSQLPVIRNIPLPQNSPVKTLVSLPLSKIDDLVAPKTPGTLRMYRGIGEVYNPAYRGPDPYYSPDYVEALDYALKNAKPGSEPHLLIAEVDIDILNDMYAYRQVQSALKERFVGLGELTAGYAQLPQNWFDPATFDPSFQNSIKGLNDKIKAQEAVLPDPIDIMNRSFARRTDVAVNYIRTTGNRWIDLTTEQQDEILRADSKYAALENLGKNADNARKNAVLAVAEDFRANNPQLNPLPKDPVVESVPPPRSVNDLGKVIAEFAADHPSLTKGAPEVQQPRATDPLTQTVTEFAADKPKIAETSTWDNFLEWIKFGGGGGRGGGSSGGDGTDEPDSTADAVKRGLLAVARLIPGLSSLINTLPPTNPTPDDAPLTGSPQPAQKTTPTPDKKPAVVPPAQKPPITKQPPVVPPPSGPAAPPNAGPDTNPKPDSAPTGGTNGGGLGSLSSLLSGLMKGLGLGQPTPPQPTPQQPQQNGGIIVQMTAQPNPVTPGQTVLVSWTSVNATTCNAFNASSTKVSSGVPGAMFQVPNVTATTSFKVYCSNTLGQYASATVQVLMK